MRRIWVIAIGWALIAAACSSTEPGPTSNAPITTSSTVASTRPVVDPGNFSMDELASGPPLAWTSSLTSDLTLVDVITIHGTVFVLGTSATEGGLSGWASTDGVSWEDLGQIAPTGTEIAAAGSIDSQLMVAATSNPGQPATLYRTTDGRTWDTEPIPFEPENPFAMFETMAIGGNEFLTILAGEEIVDPMTIVGDRLAQAILPGFDISRSRISMRSSGDDTVFDVIGPFAFRLGTAMGSELDLTSEEGEWLRQGDTNRVDLQIQPSGGPWQPGILEGAVSVFSIAGHPSGEIVATGVRGQQGIGMWTSFEGLSWELTRFTEHPVTVTPWQDRLIGPSASGDGDLLISEDATTWVRTGLGQRFPATPDWFVTHVGAGESGVVVAMQSFAFPERGPNAIFDPPTIERDDLTVAPNVRGLDISEAGSDVVHTYFSSDPSVESSLTIDLANETFTFLTEDGTELIVLTFEELRALEEEWDRIRFEPVSLNQALAFSPDTSTWTTWDMESIREGIHPEFVAQAGESLIVGLDREDGAPGFEIWTAPLP